MNFPEHYFDGIAHARRNDNTTLCYLKHITEYDFRTSAVPAVIPRIRIVSLSKTSYEEYCRNLTIKYYGPPNWMEDEPMVQKLNPELDRALPFFYR